MLFYSLGWTKDPVHTFNRITVHIKGITSEGKTLVLHKHYEEWLGVCTHHIHKMLQLIQQSFPGIHLRYKKLNHMQYKKVLPHFKDKLLKHATLSYTPKHFYKIYSNNAYVHDIGMVMNQYKFSYYLPTDWLVRLYIDFCNQYQSQHFFYMWYEVSEAEMLLDAMQLQVDCKLTPHLQVASFDLETVPLDGENRVPTGHDERDRIVMISLVTWQIQDPQQVDKKLLYLNPISKPLAPVPDYAIEFQDEKKMLKTFHALIQDVHILTGYNINNFDLPCLLARVVLLQMTPELNLYSSKKVGKYLVPTFQDKLVVDMYIFIQKFSNFNLPSLKLDVVAHCKLKKNKFPIKSTTIHHYYTKPVTRDLLLCTDKTVAYQHLQPKHLELSEFGTYLDCLQYCLEDSLLVYELFQTELTLPFLMERANTTILTIEQALYYGNTKYIVDVFKTFGTCMGYFLNMEFFKNTVDQDLARYQALDLLVFKKNKWSYQGALNFGNVGNFYHNVATLDFLSMYPSILVNHNLSYETSALIDLDTYKSLPDTVKQDCEWAPYRKHAEAEFRIQDKFNHQQYAHPDVDWDQDRLIMISYKREKGLGFLPHLMHIFLEKRKAIQKEYKQTKDITLYTRQLNIKLFLNSMYGAMGSADFPLACLDIAMSITCFARMYLLATSEYTTQVMGYETVYGDTDSVFVVDYPYSDCQLINRYLNQPYMILQFEKIVSHLLIISKKRYVYELKEGEYVMAGFEKKANALVKWMTHAIVPQVLEALKRKEADWSLGWWIWVHTLVQAFLMCRNPKTYCITRKTKLLHEYKSTSCPQLKILKQNPSKAGEFIEYTYSATDIADKNATKWIMLVEDCQEVNLEKLLSSQKKILVDLLNVAFFKSHQAMDMCCQVLNTMKWKGFVNAELTSLRKYQKPIKLLVLKGVNYTFELNTCTS